ncbi:MAG TPA: hypothetical protein VIV12_02415 [Streptosporangiaceae bacterium]
MTENADLLYAGRDRKRPPGASDLVQRIWLLLRDHPEGMTRNEIWGDLRDGWLDTDAYRSYQQTLTADKIIYGTDDFKSRAQRWAISRSLAAMKWLGTARRDGERWFAARPPKAGATADRVSLVPLDQIANSRDRANRDMVAREHLKAKCRAALEDGRTSKGHRALATEVLAYLSGP